MMSVCVGIVACSAIKGELPVWVGELRQLCAEFQLDFIAPQDWTVRPIRAQGSCYQLCHQG